MTVRDSAPSLVAWLCKPWTRELKTQDAFGVAKPGLEVREVFCSREEIPR